MNEIFRRTAVQDTGYVSVRYPEYGYKRMDKHYRSLAESFEKYAVKHKLIGMLASTVAYEDEAYISVITQARLYESNVCVRRHTSSFVWHRGKDRLCYIKKRGIRRSNLSYNGTELSIFD